MNKIDIKMVMKEYRLDYKTAAKWLKKQLELLDALTKHAEQYKREDKNGRM